MVRHLIDLIEKANEAIPDILYHGTSSRALVRIIGLDAICGSEDDNGGSGIFCSDWLQVSWSYTPDATFNSPPGGVLVLPTAPIMAGGWAIEPYQYYGRTDDDEFTIQGADLPTRYISEILFKEADFANFRRILTTNPSQLYIDHEWESADEFMEAVEKVLAYPRFKVV